MAFRKCLSLALLLLPLVRAVEIDAPKDRCPTIIGNELQPCVKCTAMNFQEGYPLCAFCYKTQSCVQVFGGAWA